MMDRKDYDNSLLRQAQRFEEYVKIVCDNVSAQVNKLPVKELWDAQKIFISGCGDSYLAGIAAKPAFESLCKIETNAMRAIEFSRILNNKNLGYSPNTPLVILISYSGGASRVVECAERCARYGANTIAITNNPQSPLAKACRYTINVGLPADGEYHPGETTYNASMLALFMIALRIGRVRNTISPLELDKIRNSILDYAAQVQGLVEDFAERCFDLACKWIELKAEDFVGDYADYATAFFSSAKVIECYGGYTTYDDSEDWCHINFFLAEPERIGRVLIANSSSPSYGRMKETIAAVKLLGSPAIIISDSDRSEFPETMEVFTFPKPDYFWLNPLAQHIPFDLIAGYIGAMKGTKPYRGEDERYQSEICQNRLKSGTQIVII